jgi:hypothetical protein
VTALKLLVWSLAGIFAGTGILHVAGPHWLRATYRGWGYSAWFSLIVGFLDLTAAMLLLTPELRGWGIGLSATILFFAIVLLLDHEKYLVAVPAAVVMLALVPATLSVPSRNHAPYSIERPTQISQN